MIAIILNRNDKAKMWIRLALWDLLAYIILIKNHHTKYSFPNRNIQSIDLLCLEESSMQALTYIPITRNINEAPRTRTQINMTVFLGSTGTTPSKSHSTRSLCPWHITFDQIETPFKQNSLEHFPVRCHTTLARINKILAPSQARNAPIGR